MAILELNSGELKFEVDLNPIREALAHKLTSLLEPTVDAGMFSKEALLRASAKEACKIGMSIVGIEKKDRNDDPVAIMANYLIDLALSKLETDGLQLVGKKIEEAGAVLTESAADANKEVVEDGKTV